MRKEPNIERIGEGISRNRARHRENRRDRLFFSGVYDELSEAGVRAKSWFLRRVADTTDLGGRPFTARSPHTRIRETPSATCGTRARSSGSSEAILTCRPGEPRSDRRGDLGDDVRVAPDRSGLDICGVGVGRRAISNGKFPPDRAGLFRLVRQNRHGRLKR